MQWSDFYDAFWDWADSTRRTRISSLEDIGSGEEVVEVTLEIEDPKIRAQLIRKAMKLGAVFTREDFAQLDGELSDELYAQLGQFTGFDCNNPYFDEDAMTWDDFADNYFDWSEELTARRIRKLRDFGDAEYVCQVIMGMPTPELEDALYKQAVGAGVRFSEDQLMDMGRGGGQGQRVSDGLAADLGTMEQTPEEKRQKAVGNALGCLGMAFLGVFYVIFHALFGLTKKYNGGKQNGHISWGNSRKKGNHCDGDCANCSAHYGYRYGRRYYGHGHQWGCERGGNGGRRGLTSQD